MIEHAFVSIVKKHGISDSSLLHIYSTLRAALSRAAKLKGIAVNPILSVETPSQQKFYASSLTVIELRKVIQSAQTEPSMRLLIWRITLETWLR